MAVLPARLQSIAANHFPTCQFEGFGAKLDFRADYAPNGIGFALAVGAGTGPAKGLEGEVAFFAVTPSQSKLFAHGYDVGERKGFHRADLPI